MIIRTMSVIDNKKKLVPTITAWGHAEGTLWSFTVATNAFGQEVSFSFTSHEQLVEFLSQIGTAYIKALQGVEDERIKFLADKGVEKIMEELYGTTEEE